MSILTKKEKQEHINENERKWTKPLMEAGWTVFPSVILARQKAFGLDAVDMNILLHLARHWWEADRLPYPGKKTLADCIGVTPRTIQRHITKMHAAGLIERKAQFSKKDGRRETNQYDLSKLISEATPFAQEEIETRRKRKAEDDARRNRKKPNLSLVNKESEESK